MWAEPRTPLKCDYCGTLHGRKGELTPVERDKERENAENDGWLSVPGAFDLCAGCTNVLYGRETAESQVDMLVWLWRTLRRFAEQPDERKE